MAVSTIKSNTEIAETLVTTNYGIRVYFKKISGVRLLHVEGTPSGQIGTGGHTINLSGTIVEAPPRFLEKTLSLSTTNLYVLEFNIDRTIKIRPASSTNSYVNADFIY